MICMHVCSAYVCKVLLICVCMHGNFAHICKVFLSCRFCELSSLYACMFVMHMYVVYLDTWMTHTPDNVRLFIIYSLYIRTYVYKLCTHMYVFYICTNCTYVHPTHVHVCCILHIYVLVPHILILDAAAICQD